VKEQFVAERAERKKDNAIQKYIRETTGELRKVTWPTPTEAWNMTKIVLVVMAATSAFLGLLDYVFSWVVTHLLA
jgi:preprotein translocase subunit SecE